MGTGRARAAAAVLATVGAVAVGAFVVLDGRVAMPLGGDGERGETDPWTARDQWIELRGGAPEAETPMAEPNRRLGLQERLLPRYPAGAIRRIHRSRPVGFEPVVVVLHATGSGAPGSGFATLGELRRYFNRPSARASAHYAIDRSGRVMRLVAESEAAFHVATPGWNDISIGIELLNDNSGTQPYPAPQLAALTQLVRMVGTRYGIPVEGVVRHSTIQPADRRDPVGFPWRTWLRSLRADRPR